MIQVLASLRSDGDRYDSAVQSGLEHRERNLQSLTERPEAFSLASAGPAPLMASFFTGESDDPCQGTSSLSAMGKPGEDDADAGRPPPPNSH